MDDNMNEEKDLAIKLIDRALKEPNSEFERINTFYDYRNARLARSATEKVVLGFKIATKELLKNYKNNLMNNIDDALVLIDYKKMYTCYIFYKNEYDILQKEIDDYELYMLTHVVSALTGGDRRDNE